MELEGNIEHENSFLTNDCFCGFRFELNSQDGYALRAL
jgi:hypothetical protein